MTEIPGAFDPYRVFDPQAWFDAMPDQMLPHAAAVADALSRNGAYAALLNATTSCEALVTRVYERQSRFLLHLTGQSTAAERRERAERAARGAQLGNGAAVGRRRDVSGRCPRVFWHEAGDGAVLLLLNGWTASGLAWPSGWLASLADRFRVIRIDNRGTGFSRTAPAPFTMSELADDAAEVLDAIGAGGATVLGSSMGGMIAQEVAIRRPDLVERLILVATRPPSPAHLLSRSPAMSSNVNPCSIR
jgi:3-oxoadipate enol-lactonase